MEKTCERLRQLDWCQLGHVVARVDPVSVDFGGPVPPDHQWVAVQGFEIVAGRPEHKERRLHPPSQRPIG